MGMYPTAFVFWINLLSTIIGIYILYLNLTLENNIKILTNNEIRYIVDIKVSYL